MQEALTNTLKHARATAVTVRLRYAPQAVTVTVTDDGRAASAAPGPAASPAGPTPLAGPASSGPGAGHGITGMRERVAALGGSLTAGPTGEGFTVHAVIPVAGS
ncbi:sensor histidine kinase [Planomonospora alba]|uniref:sensor histidine kinase n=1 Tax=Planomonospora alba TaxID=161354 RepID=UPI0031E52C71